MIYIKNAKIVLEDGILSNGVIVVEKDRIVAVGRETDVCVSDEAKIIDANGSYVGPGFVDIHVHGGGGAFFAEDPETATAHFLAHGETTILPTFYTTMDKNAFVSGTERVQSLMKKGGLGGAIAGFYMEGPYLNPKYGASAALNQWVGEIKESDYKEVVDKAGKDVKVWVIAPEREGIEDFMSYAKKVNPNVRFSVGHSEATPKEVERVKKYGVCLLTHCTNATNSKSALWGTRGCGPDEACFLDDEMYAEMICDSLGIHVNPDMQRLIIKIKGWDKLVLISDGFVSDYESKESLRYVADLSFDENGDLSGSKLTLDVACRNLIKHTGCSIVQAFAAASKNPAKAVGLENEVGTIEKSKKANLVFVDDEFNVQKVLLNGEFV